jgi:hypothetical protein
MNQEELDQILTDHRLWLSTDGKLGKRADLRRADLCRADLQEVDLRWADLFKANLRGANLRGANLTDANLSDTDLREVDPPLSIRDCFSFHSAKFSPEALPWLILHPKWPDWKDVTQIAAE